LQANASRRKAAIGAGLPAVDREIEDLAAMISHAGRCGQRSGARARTSRSRPPSQALPTTSWERDYVPALEHAATKACGGRSTAPSMGGTLIWRLAVRRGCRCRPALANQGPGAGQLGVWSPAGDLLGERGRGHFQCVLGPGREGDPL